MCTVSVIIPTYNCAEWIDRAIRSVAAESAVPTEIIVIDDGSRDDTRSAVSAWLSTGRVRYVYQQNTGLPGARNAGAQLARGRYLAFLDADDALAPGAIPAMTAAMERSGAAWCLIDIVRMASSGSEVQKTAIPDGDLLFEILKYNFIRRGMFFRRSEFDDVGMYDENIRMCEDWELNIRMFERQKPFVYLPEALYLYTKREGSITTGRVAENLSYTEQVFRKHHKRLADGGDQRIRRLYAELMWNMARRYLYSVRMPRAAVRSIRESLRYEMKIGRLLHPLGYLAVRAFDNKRRAAAERPY